MARRVGGPLRVMGATDIAEAESAEGTKGKRGAHLEPFTSETAAAAGRKSGEVRRARAQAMAMERKKGAEALNALLEEYEGQELPPVARAFVLDLMRRVATREIPVRNGAEAAALAKAVHEIYRLETGQSTSNSLSLALSSGDALEQLEQLRQSAAPSADADEA